MSAKLEVPELAVRINKVRRKLNLKQVKFAQRLGTSQAVVSTWLAGKHRPTPAMLVRIAEIAPEHDKSYFLKQAGIPVTYLPDAIAPPPSQPLEGDLAQKVEGSLGKGIKDIRRRVLKLSQTQLSARLGVSQSHVSRWEKGIGLPEPGYLIKLASLVKGTDEARSLLEAAGVPSEPLPVGPAASDEAALSPFGDIGRAASPAPKHESATAKRTIDSDAVAPDLYRLRLQQGFYSRVARQVGLGKNGRSNVRRVVAGERISAAVELAICQEIARINREVERYSFEQGLSEATTETHPALVTAATFVARYAEQYRFRGVLARVSRELDVSVQHVQQVALGQRQSQRVLDALVAEYRLVEQQV